MSDRLEEIKVDLAYWRDREIVEGTKAIRPDALVYLHHMEWLIAEVERLREALRSNSNLLFMEELVG